MEAVLFAGPTGNRTFRIVLSLMGELGAVPTQYSTVRVADEPVRVRLYSFADEIAMLLGVSDNQDSVVRLSIESGIEHVAFRIGRYKYRAIRASGGKEVIISEADRLQVLVDRLSGPKRQPLDARPVNIHEICERVCALIQAEFRERVALQRDYDASAPDLQGDAARLMQAVLNVARNAAQELVLQKDEDGAPPPQIVLRTRVARQVVLAHRRHRLAMVLSIIDNGPGVPEHIRERIFHPLVTARPGGTGLGLSLAQDFVRQHGGLIEFESRPRHTEFRLILPMEQTH